MWKAGVWLEEASITYKQMQQSWKTPSHHILISVTYLYTYNEQSESRLIK